MTSESDTSPAEPIQAELARLQGDPDSRLHGNFMPCTEPPHFELVRHRPTPMGAHGAVPRGHLAGPDSGSIGALLRLWGAASPKWPLRA